MPAPYKGPDTHRRQQWRGLAALQATHGLSSGVCLRRLEAGSAGHEQGNGAQTSARRRTAWLRIRRPRWMKNFSVPLATPSRSRPSSSRRSSSRPRSPGRAARTAGSRHKAAPRERRERRSASAGGGGHATGRLRELDPSQRALPYVQVEIVCLWSRDDCLCVARRPARAVAVLELPVAVQSDRVTVPCGYSPMARAHTSSVPRSGRW